MWQWHLKRSPAPAKDASPRPSQPLFTRVRRETVWKIGIGPGARVRKGSKGADQPFLAANEARSRGPRLFSKQFQKKNSPKFACGLLDEVAWVRGGLITFNTNLSRFSVRSHTALLVILVIRARPDTEGGRKGAI